MQRIFLLFIVVHFSLIFLSEKSLAQEKFPDASYRLIAERYGVEKIYMPGKKLFVQFQTGNGMNEGIKARGFFAGSLRDSIVLGRQKDAWDRVLIDPESVVSVRRIRPTSRIIVGCGGLLLMTAGIVLLERGFDKDASGLSPILIGAPLLFAGTYMTFYVPISLIVEKLSEKKRRKGWTFLLNK